MYCPEKVNFAHKSLWLWKTLHVHLKRIFLPDLFNICIKHVKDCWNPCVKWWSPSVCPEISAFNLAHKKIVQCSVSHSPSIRKPRMTMTPQRPQYSKKILPKILIFLAKVAGQLWRGGYCDCEVPQWNGITCRHIWGRPVFWGYFLVWIRDWLGLKNI